jgi:hypothetical protein
MRARIRQARSLDDRQRIDIGAQRNAWLARVADPGDRRRRRIGNAIDVPDAQRIKLRSNRGGGFEFLVTQFRNAMQLVPKLRDAPNQLFDERFNGHTYGGYSASRSAASPKAVRCVRLRRESCRDIPFHSRRRQAERRAVSLRARQRLQPPLHLV